MDTLRCRAYTRQKVFERTLVVEKLEKQVTEANQKVIAIQKENKRYKSVLKPLHCKLIDISLTHRIIEVSGALQNVCNNICPWLPNMEGSSTV